ncbi:MAG TPA: hypothetical protein PKZ76_09485 [Xanthomonadaceae bacterium]|nr:hypothetical protein [Xanthomonadaceae bacterium]
MKEQGSNGAPATRRRISAEMITALSAVLIGVCAVTVSLYETTLMRQQIKGASWPHVDLGYSYNQDGFRYIMVNNGVGPARIIHAIVRVDEQPVPDWQALFEALDLKVGNYMTSMVSRRVMAPGSMVELLVLSPKEDVDRFHALQSRISAEVCFCSVHNDCWRQNTVDEAQPVRSCDTAVEPLFVN